MRRRPYIRCPMSCVGSMFAAVVESRRQTLTGRWTADFGRSAIVFIIHRSVFRGGRGSFEWTQFVVGGRAASASESEMPAETAARTYNGRYMNTYRQTDRQTDRHRTWSIWKGLWTRVVKKDYWRKASAGWHQGHLPSELNQSRWLTRVYWSYIFSQSLG